MSDDRGCGFGVGGVGFGNEWIWWLIIILIIICLCCPTFFGGFGYAGGCKE